MLCAGVPFYVTTRLLQPSFIFIRPVPANFLATQNAASALPLVPVALPPHNESDRNDTSRPSCSCVILFLAGLCIVSLELWASAARQNKSAVTEKVNEMIYFFMFFVCIRAINDYICKLA